MDAAQRFSKETASWYAPSRPADAIINPAKETVDGRADSMAFNDGFTIGAVNTHKDSIVGDQFRLISMPDWKYLGLTQEWAREFQEEVESKFSLWANSPSNWVDAARVLDFTEMIRLVVSLFAIRGEAIGTVEWMRQKGRPFRTAIQMIEVDRLSNPNEMEDNEFLRRGIKRNNIAYLHTLSFNIARAVRCLNISHRPS